MAIFVFLVMPETEGKNYAAHGGVQLPELPWKEEADSPTAE